MAINAGSGDAVNKIKERLSIVDVISPYVELHKAGKNMKGKSPFTNEKTPSFYVSPDRGMYYCFSSSQGGDMFTFVEKMEGVDFKGALKILADKAGVELVPEDPQKRSERDTQYTILEEATKYFQGQLMENSEAKEYLKKRGVKDETIFKWRIGYVPGPPKNGWRHTREFLASKGYKDEAMLKAGLVKSAESGKQPYDVFRDRIMFPINDPSGRVVAYSGRVLTKDSDAPKYVNSPETELFNKSEILFGYDKAKEGIRKFDFSLIVEGQFDVVLSHQAGYNNAVAVSGTALTLHHVSLLQRLSNRVVLSLDADRAGISAVKRAAELMLPRGVDLKVAELPDGKDPADLIATDPKLFKQVIGSSMHVIEFLLHVLRKETKDDRTFKLRTRDEVLPYLLKIDSHIDREHFVGVVALALNTNPEAIRLEVARLVEAEARKPVGERVNTEEVPIKERTSGNRKAALLSYLVTATELLGEKESAVINAGLVALTGEDAIKIKEQLPKEQLSEYTFTLEQNYEGILIREIHEELADKLLQLKDLLLKETLALAKTELKAVEQSGDEVRTNECLQKIQDVQVKLQPLNWTIESFRSA